MIPVVTYFLDARDIGIVALILPLASLGAMTAFANPGYVITSHFPGACKERQKSLLSSVALWAWGLAAALSILIYFATLPLADFVLEYKEIPRPLLALALLTAVIGIPTTIAGDILTLQQRAPAFSILIIGQVLSNAISTSISLAIFKLGILSIFIGNLCAAVFGLLMTLILLREFLTLAIDRSWFREIRKLGFSPTMASITDVAQANIERSVLANYTGLAQVGLYSHSLTYFGVAKEAVKAMARAIWPRTLAEARDLSSSFTQTIYVWRGVYIGLALAGVFLAWLGKPLVAVLTHERLTDAYILLPWWIIALLAQNLGRASVGVLLAHGRSRIYSQLVLASNLVWLCTIVATVRPLGILAGVIAVIAQQLFMRIGMQIVSRKVRHIPRTDSWAWYAAAIVLVAIAASEWADWPLKGRIAGLACFSVAIMFVGWRPFKDFFRVLFDGKRYT